MKIRTKVILLLSAGLIATTLASTLLQVFWTNNVLEREAKTQAEDSARDIQADLEKTLKEDSDADDISDALKEELRFHPHVANIEVKYEGDEDTTSFTLGFREEEPRIKSTPHPARKRPAVRRDEVRRALSDHGESSRPPAFRQVDPLWRTPDRYDSPEWAHLAARLPAQPRRPIKAFLVEQPDESQRQQRAAEAQVELTKPRRGILTARVSLEPAERLVRYEKIISATVTGAVLLLLLLGTTYILNQIVGRPVSDLASAMRRVGEGDLSPRVVEGTADEIGVLARGFNAMLGRLAVADEEIHAFNRRLAEEIAAATADLARKNEALGQLNRLLIETQRELGDKERLAALGQLAAQLAHEIGTPLGSVSGHIQLALASRDLPAPLRERLLVATKEVERVSKIVRDYLDSTRPIKPDRLDTDAVRLVDEAIGIALGSGAPAGVSIERHISPGAAHLSTDPGLLRQVLVNLLTNAIDAVSTREGGHIVVRGREQGGVVELQVEDDGVGIAPEDAARIFEPFYTTKGRGKGTGLGLAICRELAVALGGALTVDSHPGRGSTFTLRLAAPRPAAALAHPAARAP